MIPKAVRRVNVAPYRCACGHLFLYIGVCKNQPQPTVGDHIACPSCMSIYRLGETFEPTLVAERDIPLAILKKRDYVLSVLKKSLAS